MSLRDSQATLTVYLLASPSAKTFGVGRGLLTQITARRFVEAKMSRKTLFLFLLPSETESENEFRPLDERIDEFHPKATRTLFIGNLEKTTTYHDLRNIFQRFGGIVVCTGRFSSLSGSEHVRKT